VRTTALRDGDELVLDGQKTFITNGRNEDLVIVVAKTDPSKGAKGNSLVLVETSRPGFKRGRNLENIGMKAQDTSELFFDDIRLPASNVLGGEGEGLFPKLVAAVTEAGGIGVLACADKDPEQIVAMAAETRKLTSKPFGMDIGLPARVETYGHDFRTAAAQAHFPPQHLALRERFLQESGNPFDDAARATPGRSSVASFRLGETFEPVAPVFCGQGVARIDSVLPAHEIVTRMIDEARDILQRELPARVSFN
jgi:hypothetical protein